MNIRFEVLLQKMVAPEKIELPHSCEYWIFLPL